ncbi:MAG: hypothetical protein GY870_01555 [archaeon]|nr:hypothetical protein [archaeon]
MVWKQIDASGLILGRFSTEVVNLVKNGNHIVITNATEAQISGNKRNIVDHYLHYKRIKTHTNHRKGPFRVGTRPDIFIRKTIKGMLPKNERGKLMVAKIHVYISSIPKEKQEMYGENIEKIEFPAKFQAKNLRHKMISVGEVCEIIGWNHGGMN